MKRKRRRRGGSQRKIKRKKPGRRKPRNARRKAGRKKPKLKKPRKGLKKPRLKRLKPRRLKRRREKRRTQPKQKRVKLSRNQLKGKAWKKLTNLRYVGEKSARKLYAAGYRKKTKILRENPKKLAKIIGPIAYRVVRKRIRPRAGAREQTRVGVIEQKKATRGLKNIFLSGLDLFRNLLFGRKKTFKFSIYGPTNVGKTTLANRISMDFTGGEMGTVSNIPHETRVVNVKKGVELDSNGKKIVIDLADTPGFSTRIEPEQFAKKYGLSKKASKQRAMEAASGVIQALKWLDETDMVLMVLDSTKKPADQANIMFQSNLQLRKIPAVVVANKTDLTKADVDAVAKAYPMYRVVGVSAKKGENMDNFYRCVVETATSL